MKILDVSKQSLAKALVKPVRPRIMPYDWKVTNVFEGEPKEVTCATVAVCET